ncbi:hypothetical protein BG004_007157 [Podila humilis]|nr:hypothetical protein BG004_007157 [Podila humilis]
MATATRIAGYAQDPSILSQQENSEILPDSVDGILRRMEEEVNLMPMTDPASISCTHRFCRECILQNLRRKPTCPLCGKKYDRRSLCTLEHMAKVVNVFNELKEAYEQEHGYALSQAPRHYEALPQENLTQLYPYPEKEVESQESSGSATNTSKGKSKARNDKSSDKNNIVNAEVRQPLSEETRPHESQSRRVQDERIELSEQPQLGATRFPEPEHQELQTQDTTDNEATQVQGLDKTDQEQETQLLPTSDVHVKLEEESRSQVLVGNEAGHIEPDTDIEMAYACFDVDLDTVSEDDAAMLAAEMLRLMDLSRNTRETHQPVDLHPDHDHGHDPELFPIKQENDMEPQPSVSGLPVSIPAEDLEGTKLKSASLDETFILTTTNLDASYKTMVEKVSKALKATVVDELSSKPTHVIVRNVSKDDTPGSGRTMKLLMGITTAAWIVQYDWILESMETGYWVREDEYQLPDNEFKNNGPKRARICMLRGDDPLFHGYEFQLCGTVQHPSKADLERVIAAGGGLFVSELFRHDLRLRDAPQEAQATPDHHVLLFDSTNKGFMHLRKLRADVTSLQAKAESLGKRSNNRKKKTLQVVGVQTLLDAIYQHDTTKLVDTEIGE